MVHKAEIWEALNSNAERNIFLDLVVSAPMLVAKNASIRVPRRMGKPVLKLVIIKFIKSN